MAAPTYEKLSSPKQGSRVTVDGTGRWCHRVEEGWRYPSPPLQGYRE